MVKDRLEFIVRRGGKGLGKEVQMRDQQEMSLRKVQVREQVK